MSAIAFNNVSLACDAKKLTTGGDDPLLPKLIHAINHASEIEIAVSFVQCSGLNLLFEPLKDAILNGAILKLLTSDYLDITDPVALRELMPLLDRGADIRIYQSDNKQAFHMKSYIFVKTVAEKKEEELIDGCAFIGSNNISKSALTTGHEWCFRHDYLPPRTSREALEFNYIRSAFNEIFAHPLVHKLDHDWISAYLRRRKMMQFVSVDPGSPPEYIEPATPNHIQIEALTALVKSREIGFKRGLVVLATGMGKTWLAAFDVLQLKAKRILFVAHREEILLQAQRTFAQLMPEKSSGFYNAQNRQKGADVLFASVQTIGRENHLQQFSKDHFDYVVVDEFHHASAPVYSNLLAYFNPDFLLGLTATPERTDQSDILCLCDNNLVYERNLTQGIDDKILAPFKYYGIWDESVNYQAIPWRNGRFDPESIDNQFATQKRASHILKKWHQFKQQKTLAFCISVKHADYMAESFNNAGIKAVSVHSKSEIRRNEALTQLQNGTLEVMFSVDLFNEGTDLPALDTILMLRPSNSKILFLQQLGRGLRLHKNKTHLVVLDFIGNHHSFLNKPYALFGSSTIPVLIKKVKEDKLADGCFVNYDIEITQFWKQLAKQQRTTAIEDYQNLYEQLGHRPTASEFLNAYGDLNKVNKQHKSWMALVAAQQQEPEFSDLIENYGDFLLEAVQATAMAKSFKAILLEAFLRLDGFSNPPTLEKLAKDSKLVFDRYPLLKQSELSKNLQHCQSDSVQWLEYWKKNPIKFSCTVNNKTGKQWFKIKDNRLVVNLDVREQDKPALHDAVQELLTLRLLQYSQRPNKVSKAAVNQQENNSLIKREKAIQLAFYPNLKIACGHFKTGDDLEFEYKNAPVGFGHLQADKHFLAKASGNSMDGGKNPVRDGDTLLLEKITPTSAGSLQGLTVAIEKQDEAGDGQCLLRVVKKTADGRYKLVAKNPDYKTIYADEDMQTFARLKGVVR
ncbi:type III restriction enzyme, res subunit [Psychromonas ingrahamii 37]|uniref:Type III restriction enzyme, res subunit n=1 Tax=Psychromonas ingrahamii (strain DSM 17664 / CCUG 51855 / 37) TaxID=357804 RepID=A1SXM9_PSYIN|nr:DEAD/DEAH box helicase family protein [Psychromonas ingrahamii]ABM04244.1 type III restriction enzyme, res subunit [Psychromonas ingrahamii 37]